MNYSHLSIDERCCIRKYYNEGHLQNSNGLLKEFYPKGRCLSRGSEKTLKKNLALMNARPRKVLGFKSPVELFESELKK